MKILMTQDNKRNHNGIQSDIRCKTKQNLQNKNKNASQSKILKQKGQTTLEITSGSIWGQSFPVKL